MIPEISMVPVPEGRIRMHDDRITNLWALEIMPFSRSRYPVTQGHYRKVTKKLTPTLRGEPLPAETVSWMEAVQLCFRPYEMAGFRTCYTLGLGKRDDLGYRNAGNVQLIKPDS